MTDTIHQIEQDLQMRETQLFDASMEFREFVLDAAQKRAGYDVDFAKSMLDIASRADKDGLKMTVSERESLAVVAVQNQLRDCRIAEALRDGSKAHLSTLQSLLTSLQTRSKLIITERSLSNYSS